MARPSHFGLPSLGNHSDFARSDPHRILVVEDEGVVALDLMQRLRRMGYEVVGPASSSEEALEFAVQTHPDLVLMDIVLKGESDGIETARVLHLRTNLGVVYLMAHADEDTLARAKATSPCGYLLKPLRDQEIRCTIELALSQRELARDLAEALDRSRAAEENVRGLNARLDTRVAVRTVELQGVVKRLGREVARHRRNTKRLIREQQSLLRSEEHFRLVAEAVPSAMIIAEADGRVTFANLGAEKLFGLHKRELLGISIESLMPQQYRIAHRRYREEFHLDGRRQANTRCGLSCLRADGSEVPVDIELNPIVTRSGPATLASITDISERLRLERALQEKNTELINAMQAKDRFITGMSHELRTPLTSIIGYAGTLLMRLHGELTEEQSRHLATIERNANHLLSMINDVLDLAKIGSGKMEMHPERVRCRGIIEEVVAALAPQAQERHLTLGQRHCGREFHVWCDRRALYQILVNLVINAIKFTDHGGVEIAVDSIRTQGGRRVRIDVRDTGRGITHDDCQGLFREFSQVGAPLEGQSRGTGLGLHLSARLANLIGGELRVASEPDQGSVFSLLLPEKELSR
jgi:PAS domain S-box-containing protein